MVVYIVGAGPGDPELITLKAKRLIKNAEVLIYDRLVDEKILSWAPPNCKLIYFGKRDNKSHPSQKIQRDINSTLLEYGPIKRVVRLKGGDPFIFGRGGEEAMVCTKAGINFEIIPGISSFYAAPAYAGIPLTHRDFNSVFAVLTGHESIKAKSSINWKKLPETIVVLMGVSKIQEIAKNLLESGREKTTPVAAIRWGSKLEQNTKITNLGDLAEGVNGIKPPTVFVIGSITTLNSKLNWFEKKLGAARGKKIVLTQTLTHTKKTMETLESYGIESVNMPLIEIESRDYILPNINDYDSLIFTSMEGVKRVGEKIDLKSFKGKIFSIGPKTKSFLFNNYGVNSFIGDKYNSEGLANYVLKYYNEGKKLLLLRSSAATKTLLNMLSPRFDVSELYVYDIKQLPADPELIKGADAIFVVSASCSKSLVKLEKELLEKITIVSIGPETSRYLTIPHITASVHTIQGMVDEYLNYLWSEML